MKKTLVLTLCAFFTLTVFTALAMAKPVSSNPFANYNIHITPRGVDDLEKLDNLHSASQIDTFDLGDFDFDELTGCSFQGWTSQDFTDQLEIYWHVVNDTNSACIPTQVMWCGQEPNTAVPYCGWADLPGYGNNWAQYLCTPAFAFSGTITWKYRIAWDTEIGFDFVNLQYDSAGSWVDRLILDGQSGDTISCYEDASVDITPVGLSRTKLRFCFTADGAFSDEDGFDPSDWGAVAVDNLVVTDDNDTLVAFEDFEDEFAGERGVGDTYATEGPDTTWFGYLEPPIGDYVGVDNGLFEEDPCRDNFTCQLFYYFNSTLTDPNYPGTFVTPRDINNDALSPKMDWDQGGTIPSTAGVIIFHYEVYRDLPLGGSVFYTWSIRTYQTVDPTCPGQWNDRNFVYYGPDKDFLFVNENVTDLIDPGPDAVQVRVGVVDLCDPFCVDFGFPGVPHTPSPTFDNISVIRLGIQGPSWAFRTIDLFQDNFPDDGSTTGTGRIDAANDINPAADPINLPGDSMTVDCSAAPEGGLQANPLFYFRVVAGPDSGLTGASVQGDYGTFVGTESGWNVLQMDTSRTAGGAVVDGKWAIDLNDSLFVAGDVLQYFFKATTALNNTGIFTSTGVENQVGTDTTGGAFFEVSILPVGNGDILYVDDFDMRGNAEAYYTTALDQAGYHDAYDKYDVNGTTSAVGNGPGGRVKALSQIQGYNKILWNTGDLDVVTISDGQTDKGDDASLLRDYLNLTNHDVGLWVSGDDVAFDLNQSTQASALDLLNNWCGVTWLSQSQFLLTGIAAPVIHAEPGSPWDGVASCSTHVAYGGCLVINKFDVMETNAGASYAFTWPGHNPGGGDARGAVITNSQLNSTNNTARTIWQSYSFHYVRDDVPSVPMDRTCFLGQALIFLGNAPGLPVSSDDLPQVYSLDQNTPNPFNPTTKINFALPKAGNLTLVVYNVAGQRVKTLYSGFHKAGPGSVVWDGTNDAGRKVTSGVYFYRINAGDFQDQKKMVLLK